MSSRYDCCSGGQCRPVRPKSKKALGDKEKLQKTKKTMKSKSRNDYSECSCSDCMNQSECSCSDCEPSRSKSKKKVSKGRKSYRRMNDTFYDDSSCSCSDCEKASSKNKKGSKPKKTSSRKKNGCC